MNKEGEDVKELLLNSIEILGFRAFDHLVIEKFGRVNLVVGKNNVGKSTLLEALWLYTQRARLSVIVDLLKSRDELPRISRQVEDVGVNSKDRIWEIKHLFNGHPDVKNTFKTLSIGPANSPDETVNIGIRWYISEVDEEGEVKRYPVEDPNNRTDADPYVVTQLGATVLRVYRLDRLMDRRFRPMPGSNGESIPSNLIKANGLSAEEVAQLWDNIALTDWEDAVVSALRIIASEVQRISFLGNQETHLNRIPVVRIQGLSEPIPLRSMGDGMNRLLGVVLALVNARNGVLLIDEVENGLHYTVQVDIWRLIFRIAHALNVQVFATTHSWDCIEAFQKAAAEDMRDEGMLIRLEYKHSRIESTVFSESYLSIATREQIEVR